MALASLQRALQGLFGAPDSHGRAEAPQPEAPLKPAAAEVSVQEARPPEKPEPQLAGGAAASRGETTVVHHVVHHVVRPASPPTRRPPSPRAQPPAAGRTTTRAARRRLQRERQQQRLADAAWEHREHPDPAPAGRRGRQRGSRGSSSAPPADFRFYASREPLDEQPPPSQAATRERWEPAPAGAGQQRRPTLALGAARQLVSSSLGIGPAARIRSAAPPSAPPPAGGAPPAPPAAPPAGGSGAAGLGIDQSFLRTMLPAPAQLRPASATLTASDVERICVERAATLALPGSSPLLRLPYALLPPGAAPLPQAAVKGKAQEVPAPEECLFCFEAAPLLKLNPCGHRLMCDECTRRYVGPWRPGHIGERAACPICREPVASFSEK